MYFFLLVYVTFRNECADRANFLQQCNIEPSQQTVCNNVTILDMVILIGSVIGISYVLSMDLLGAPSGVWPCIYMCLSGWPLLGVSARLHTSHSSHF